MSDAQMIVEAINSLKYVMQGCFIGSSFVILGAAIIVACGGRRR